MNQSRRIYVDLDDVLSETARAFTLLLEQRFQKRVAFDEILSFDLGQSFDLDASELAQFMELVHQPENLSALEPVDGSADALQAFTSLGYEIAVITGRPPSTAEVSKAWLEIHGIPYHSLTCVDKYGRREYHGSYSSAITLDELAQLSFCFAVEDSGEMAVFLSTQMGVPVALLDRPWNRELAPSHSKYRASIQRCHDWRDVLARFKLGQFGS